VPLSADAAYALTARERDRIAPMPTEADENGVPNRKVRAMRLRARLSRYWYGTTIESPTLEELERAREHASEGDPVAGELTAGPADGHQLDGRGEVRDR